MMVPIMMAYRMKMGMAQMLPLIITPTLNSPLATICHAIDPHVTIHIFHTVFNIPLAPSDVPSYAGSTLLAVLGISIFVYGVIYIGLVYRKCKEEGINPWRRV